MEISINKIKSRNDVKIFLADFKVNDDMCFEDKSDYKCIKRKKIKSKSSQYELEIINKKGKIIESKILDNPQDWMWDNRKLINKELKKFDDSIYSDDFGF